MTRWALLLTLLAGVLALAGHADVSWASVEGSAKGVASAVEVAACRTLDGDLGGALRALLAAG